MRHPVFHVSARLEGSVSSVTVFLSQCALHLRYNIAQKMDWPPALHYAIKHLRSYEQKTRRNSLFVSKGGQQLIMQGGEIKGMMANSYSDFLLMLILLAFENDRNLSSSVFSLSSYCFWHTSCTSL